MRRTLSLLMVLCILAGCVSSCTKSENSPESTSADTAVSSTIEGENGSFTDGLYTYTVNDDEATIIEYSGYEKNIVIPDRLGGYKTVAIASSVFKNLSVIESVTIPDGVRSIGSSAFAGTSAEAVVLPDSISVIGSSAFAETPWYEALSDEFVIVGDGICIKYNGSDADLTIPGSIKFVSNLFRYSEAEIKSITLSDGTETIGDRAFAGLKSLESISFSSTVTEIGDHAFTLCTALQSVTVPETVTTLGQYAFSHCKALTYADIESNISVLPDSLFLSCTSLSDVKLPSQLTSLESSPFEECAALENITVSSGITEIEDSIFEGNNNITIHCEESSYAYTYFTEKGFSTVSD